HLRSTLSCPAAHGILSCHVTGAPTCPRPVLSAHLLSCPDSPCPHLLTAEPNRLPLSVVPIRHRTPPLDSLPLSITRTVVPIGHQIGSASWTERVGTPADVSPVAITATPHGTT